METEETYVVLDAPNNFILTSPIQGYLLTAGRWASFLGILGFICCGLFFIFAIMAGSVFSRMAAVAPYNPMFAAMAGFGWGISAFYILLDVVYFFFALYLYQFATKIKAAINFNDQAQLTTALEKLKSFFKLWGIITIVLVALYILIFIGFIIFSITAASAMR